MSTGTEAPIVTSESGIFGILSKPDLNLLKRILDEKYTLPSPHAFIILQKVTEIMNVLNIYTSRHPELMPEYDAFSKMVEKRIDQLTKLPEGNDKYKNGEQ